MGRKIRLQPDPPATHYEVPLEFAGWYDGSRSYLWIGFGDQCRGILSGRKLYRFAKAIVRQFERTPPPGAKE